MSSSCILILQYSNEKYRMGRKHVTWSPVVAHVHRPLTRHKRLRRRQSSLILHLKGSDPREIKGTLVAHARRDTHSLLLTIRNAEHRDMQILIDLPARRVRKVYDGQKSWTVEENASETIRVTWKTFGTVFWRDDNTVRKPDARGFSLSWLKEDGGWSVRMSHARRGASSRSKNRGSRGNVGSIYKSRRG